MYSLNDYLEKMRGFPEHKRKLFAVAMMVIATAATLSASWFLLSPLPEFDVLPLNKTLTPPIVDTTIPNEINSLMNNSQNASANRIPEIGPVKESMDAFKAAMNMLAPQYMQKSSQGNISEAWTTQLTRLITTYAQKTKTAFIFILNQLQIFITHVIEKISAFVEHKFNTWSSKLKPTLE